MLCSSYYEHIFENTHTRIFQKFATITTVIRLRFGINLNNLSSQTPLSCCWPPTFHPLHHYTNNTHHLNPWVLLPRVDRFVHVLSTILLDRSRNRVRTQIECEHIRAIAVVLMRTWAICRWCVACNRLLPV